jgi:hypothetical protein
MLLKQYVVVDPEIRIWRFGFGFAWCFLLYIAVEFSTII